MRNGFLAVAVVGALVSTSAWARGDDARGRSSSSQPRSGGTVARQGSSASHSTSGHASEYRSPAPHYSQGHSTASHYHADGGHGYYGYHSHAYPSHGYHSYYGHGSYYSPGFSLYLGAPAYGSYYYGDGYPQAYAGAPYAGAPYAAAPYGAAPYAPDQGNGAAGDEDRQEPYDDRQAPYDDRGTAGPMDAPGSSHLRLDVRPLDATIYVDDQFRGTAGTVITLPPGRHSVEVARPGFQSERRMVDVGTGETRPLSITLQPLRH